MGEQEPVIAGLLGYSPNAENSLKVEQKAGRSSKAALAIYMGGTPRSIRRPSNSLSNPAAKPFSRSALEALWWPVWAVVERMGAGAEVLEVPLAIAAPKEKTQNKSEGQKKAPRKSLGAVITRKIRAIAKMSVGKLSRNKRIKIRRLITEPVAIPEEALTLELSIQPQVQNKNPSLRACDGKNKESAEALAAGQATALQEKNAAQSRSVAAVPSAGDAPQGRARSTGRRAQLSFVQPRIDVTNGESIAVPRQEATVTKGRSAPSKPLAASQRRASSKSQRNKKGLLGGAMQRLGWGGKNTPVSKAAAGRTVDSSSPKKPPEPRVFGAAGKPREDKPSPKTKPKNSLQGALASGWRWLFKNK